MTARPTLFPASTRSLRHILAAVCALFTMLAAPASAQAVTVFAAASMMNALGEISESYEDETGERVTVSLAGSSLLARQILLGAPADVFISANAQWMDQLEAEGAILPDSRFDLAGNRIVLIAHGQTLSETELAPGFDLAALLGEGRLAMALVDAVPVGIYGKAALENLNLWDSVKQQVVQVDNARAALALVARGEATLGVVYVSDALADSAVSVVGRFPDYSHPPVVYPAAAVRGGNLAAALRFLAFLRTPPAEQALAGQGFIVFEQ